MVVRGARKQRRHIALRPSLGKGFQILPPGIHQRHNAGRERLAEDEGRAHRQRGHDIQSEISSPQAAPDLDQKGKQHRAGRDCPSPIGPGLKSNDAQAKSKRDSDRGNRNKKGAHGSVRSHGSFSSGRRPNVQCENRIGSGSFDSKLLVAPPRTNSRKRECP